MVFNALATINVFKTTDISYGIYTTFSNIYNLGSNRTAFASTNVSGWQSLDGGGQAAAISDNGTYIIFSSKNSNPQYICYSYDGGTNWVFSDLGNTLLVQGVCMSSDGQYQYAIINGSKFYRNANYLNSIAPTWNTSTTIGSSFRGVNCSSTGQYVVVTGAAVYYSKDYGQNFITIASSSNISGLSAVYSATIVENSNGDTLYIAVLLSSTVAIYKITGASTATGLATATFITSYSTSTVASSLVNIVCSSDGKYIMCGAKNAGTNTPFFLYSSNYGSSFVRSDTGLGISFTSTTTSRTTRVTISSTGQYMLASRSGYDTSSTAIMFYYSISYGAVWTPITISSTSFTGGNPSENGTWTGVALNSVGSRCFMVTSEAGSGPPTNNYSMKAFLATATNA